MQLNNCCNASLANPSCLAGERPLAVYDNLALLRQECSASDLPYRIEMWDDRDTRVEELVGLAVITLSRPSLHVNGLAATRQKVVS